MIIVIIKWFKYNILVFSKIVGILSWGIFNVIKWRVESERLSAWLKFSLLSPPRKSTPIQSNGPIGKSSRHIGSEIPPVRQPNSLFDTPDFIPRTHLPDWGRTNFSISRHTASQNSGDEIDWLYGIFPHRMTMQKTFVCQMIILSRIFSAYATYQLLYFIRGAILFNLHLFNETIYIVHRKNIDIHYIC